MNLKACLPVVLGLVFLSGCSTFRAISLVKGGEVLSTAKEESDLHSQFRGHMILVKGKVNGSERNHTFILDTAALTIIDEKVASELGLSKEVEVEANDNAGGIRKAHLTRLDTLSLGEFTVKNPAAVIMDMARIRQMEGISVDGIVGSNFLRFFKVKIDYARRHVTLSGDTTPLNIVSGGCLVKLEQLMKQGFAPMVAAASGDVTFNAVVDTGLAEALSLPIPLLEKAGKDGMIEGKGVMGGGAFEDNNKSRLARLNSFRVGNTEFGKVVAVATEKGKLPLIGTEFLSRFVVTLNYPAGEMLLVPSDGDKPRDNVFTTGIGVVRDASGKALVSGVWSGSLADRQGIMARDEIAAINGKPASDYTLHELREIMKQDDGIEAVDLVIRNSQGDKRLTIRKEYLFEASKKSQSTKPKQVGN